MAFTSTLPEQQQPFTFASPISETQEDALDFDYESWIEQSKITNCYTSQHDKLWMDDAEREAINRHHREMMLKVVDNLPEDNCELSLRDLTDLPLSRAAIANEEAMRSSLRLSSTRKSCRNKTPSMEGVGLIIKLFMPSPSRAGGGGGGRKKSFSSSTVSMLRKKSVSQRRFHGKCSF